MKFPPVLFLVLLTLGVRSAHALDQDSDGMSDVWQRIHNIATGDTATDIDGDGQSNGKEAEAGTNPRDPNDFFRTFDFSINATLDEASLSWRSVEERYYQIEQSTDLISWDYADYRYGEYDQTTTSTTFYPYPSGQSKMFFRVRGYPEYDYDYDGDGLQSWEERLLGTDPYDYDGDTDNDGMDDGFEFIYEFDPLSSADGALDADGDQLTNAQESLLGLNPRITDSDGNGTSDADEDRDLDGLTNIQEILTHGTDPAQPDTDLDGLSDGWEILYGYSALVNNNTDGNPSNDASADPDGDGLDNGEEDQIGSSPVNADTDGDGFSDFDENQSGSQVTNPASTPANPGGTPGGPSSPPPPTVPVQVNFGDHSGSHSEKYRVYLDPLEGDANTQRRYRTNRNYGVTQTETFHLPAGAKYKVTFVHIATDPQYEGPPKPDYDYTLEFTTGGSDPAIKSIPDDPQGMLGVHDESEQFFATGKDATLYIAWLTSETVATLPSDRTRKKLGVGEEVNLTLKPASLPSPSWALAGTPGTSTLNPLAGATSMLTAGERACTPSTEATILGETVKIDFDVVEPSGATIEREPGTGLRHTLGFASVGFKGRPYILPTDVSFIKIEIREGHCLGTATGYLIGKNGEPHAVGGWAGLIPGTQANPNKVDGIDTISTGDYPPPFAAGTFTWPIPWQFRVNGGTEKQFTTVTHQEDVDSMGSTTISKGGNSETKAATDATSAY